MMQKYIKQTGLMFSINVCLTQLCAKMFGEGVWERGQGTGEEGATLKFKTKVNISAATQKKSVYNQWCIFNCANHFNGFNSNMILQIFLKNANHLEQF